MPTLRYEIKWPDDLDDAQIEREMIRYGGYFPSKDGKVRGLGLHQHFKNYWALLWPEDSQTWWTDLILENVIKNTFTSLVGPASAWKSGTVARIALMDWSCWPEDTSVMMSSTTLDGLKNRIYGETTMMWKRASERYEWFPGHPIDSKTVITFTDVDEEKARDIRNSILGIACKTSSGVFVGMGAYSGRKNRRVWCIGDEFQFMHLSILEAQDNLISNNGDGSGIMGGVYPKDHPDPIERGKSRRFYRCCFIGNTNPSVRDNPLDIVSEPENGWGSIPEATVESGKTQVWKCKKHPKHPVQCVCVNLDGLDSPNSAFPVDRPRWSQLAGPHKLAKYTPGSESYWSNGRGVFKFGLDAFKIITKELCDIYHAFDDVQWEGDTISIGALDASYGGAGSDRCPVGWFEFGKCTDGKTRLKFREMWLIPVTIRKDLLPEDQIAFFCKQKMESAGVPPENFFFDGRGTLAISLARIWSDKVNSLEFGGSPTERPAGPDLFVVDKITNLRRLQTSKEAFLNFVTELWMSAHYVIESDQMRGLTMEIVLDAQPREWRKVRGDKKQVEPKDELRERTGVSPDLADMFVVGVEGARRRGFQIDKIAAPNLPSKSSSDWFAKEAEKLEAQRKSRQLAEV
jgi:hypothetical protein